MPLDHPLGHNYGPTNIVGEASAHLGDIHHHHNTPGFDGLWDLSLSLDIVRTMRAFELLWGGSPTVFPPHRQTQPRGEREHRQSASLPKRDRKSRFREYWIEKRCEERDINPKKCGYDEAQEFCCPFLGTSKEYRSKTPRPIQQFIYQLSKEAERIKSEDPCRSEISSDDTYSVAYQIVRRIWDSQKAWNKHWLILPGEIWDKEEELTGAQSGSENVTDPDNAQINNNNETKEDLPEAIHHHPGASGTNSVPSPLSAHICPAELNSTNIAASLSSTTSSQAPPGRKFGKEAVSPMSRKELCEGLQRSHKANSTPSISTRSGKDIHSRRPSSPVSSEDKGGSATPIHPRILRSASSPSAKLREMPSRILKRKRA